MNRPDFLCIGASSSGADWLHHALSQHPKAWLGPFREYQFFNSLFIEGETDWTRGFIDRSVRAALRYHVTNPSGEDVNFPYLTYLLRIADGKFMFTEEWYSHIFSRAGKAVRGDICSSYCAVPPEGVDYVLRLMGPIPVICVIRDPVDRAMAKLREIVSRPDARKPSNEAEWERIALPPAVNVRNDYRNNVTNWMERYPTDQLLFVPYKDVATKPMEVVRAIERHVGLPEHEAYAFEDASAFDHPNIEVPARVRELLLERLEPQQAFLNETFGRDFAQRV